MIFFDRLAPTDDLPGLAPGAELIDVGKSPYHHPVSQTGIEEQLIARARRGESVVRLKGGDPFVFGRGGEELQACVGAGVPVRVVPGISSALAVPAAAGIPVTHRGVSRAFTVISGHVAARCRGVRRSGPARRHHRDLDGAGQPGPDRRRAVPARAWRRRTPAAVVERGFSDAQRST